MVETDTETLKRSLFTDFHCHLLPGLDDGPAEMPEAVEIAQVLASCGFSEVVCTPHFLTGVYQNNLDTIHTAVSALQEAIDSNRVPLKVRVGIEYYLDEYLLPSLDKPVPLFNDILLIEAPAHVHPAVLKEILYRVITRKKMRPLIAHPERCETLAQNAGERPGAWFGTLGKRRRQIGPGSEPTLLFQLKEMGCLFQGNIGSFAGIYGKAARERSHRFLERGMYDCLGTDAHRSDGLQQWLTDGMNAVAREIGNEGLHRLLRPLALSASSGCTVG